MGALPIVSFFLFSIFLFIFSTISAVWASAALSLIGVVGFGWVIFGDSMNTVQTLGKVYWIVRNNAKKGDRILSTGFMRTIDHPWLIGNGVQVRFFKYSLQVGAFYVLHFDSDEEGVLNAMTGRYMQEGPKDIGNWK